MHILNIGGKRFTLIPQASPEEFQVFNLDRESFEELALIVENTNQPVSFDRKKTESFTMESCFESANLEKESLFR